MLDIQPEKLHQRVPIFIGSEEDVKMVEKFMAEEEAKAGK
jgi:fructose-1,6-bisphosphatase I